MTMFTKLLTAAIAGAASAPLAAQYYPQPGYPGYPGYQYPGTPGYPYPGQQYGYGGQNAIAQIVDQLLGNRYNVSDRQAVRQCAFAAVNQAQYQYRGYNQGYGYNQRYGYNPGYNRMIRVTAITDVQRRNYGVRVRGLLDSGMYGYQARGGYGDLSFRCDVDYRGGVSNVRIDRNNGYRRY
jgi:hypothetical protein